MASEKVEDDATRDLSVLEPVEDFIDCRQRLQLDIRLDLSFGGEGQGLALFGRSKLVFELLVRQFIELLEKLASGGVETLIGHDLLLFPELSDGCGMNVAMAR